MPLIPGTRLGPYEILAPLGAGGMGEVYRARDTRLGREVAVKVLPAAFARNPDRMRRFEQEARAAGMLNHPNILAVYDVGTHEGSPYLVTELLEGETLRELGAISQRKALDYAQQIARGLAAAHEKGITHRDLKPENVFITRDGRVKILDFGLAKLTQVEEALPNATTTPAATTPGAVLGTVGYMSPEQVRGAAADHRADIFSFGAILYEMLSGRRAFRGETAVEAMHAILKADPPELQPAGLERIVRHCLEKNPEQRFQSAHDLGFALEALSGQSSTVAPAAIPLALRRQVSLFTSVFTAAVMVAAGLAAGYWLLSRNAAPVAWSGTLLGGPRIAFGARLSPDGRTIAFQAMVENLTQVAVMNPDSGNWTVLTKSRSLGAVDSLCWSKDGARIYYARFLDHPRGVFSVPALGGEERLLLDEAGMPEVLPDGSLLVTRINERRRWQIHHFWPQTGRLEPLPAAVLESFGTYMRAFPDGREAAFYGAPLDSGGDPGYHLYAMDLASKGLRRLDLGIHLDLAQGGMYPLGIDPAGKSVYVTVKSGDLHQVVAVPRHGSGAAKRSFP